MQPALEAINKEAKSNLLVAHARIRQYLTAQRHLLARLDSKAAAAKKRLGVQAHIGPQPGHAFLACCAAL